MGFEVAKIIKEKKLEEILNVTIGKVTKVQIEKGNKSPTRKGK